MWQERRLEVIILLIFTLLVVTSLVIIYTSYTNYALIEHISDSKALMYKVLMFISSFILFISLLLIFLKRDYLFIKRNDSTKGLKNLLEEIKYSSNSVKINQFKKMLKEKNHSEIYALISNIINELQQSKKMADEANKTKSLFLSNVSHEIRTPINGIVGFTKILSSTKLDSEQREFLTTIRKSSEDLLAIVENILDVSKIENGSIEVENSYFNILDEIENLSDIYALDASKKGVDFSFWIDPSLSCVLVESDSEKIKQVLMNLISNAIKFTKPNGVVDVSIKKIEQKEKSLLVEFLVSDTGIGISEEQQTKVFYAFTQADNSNTRAYGGIGLGLTISNAWAQMLGGQLQLESIEGEGSTLSFVLELNQKDILIEDKIEPLNIAVYTPLDAQKKISNRHLKGYLSALKTDSIYYFKNFVECKDGMSNSIDILYLHYNKINKEELQRIVAQYSSSSQIVLLTKLDNRFKILDIAPIFSQIIYEPVTFSKVKKSLEISSRNRKIISKESSEKLFNLKALVVEDNKVNQRLIVHTLKSIGIESDIADEGAIAVEMFKKKRYDIVFMDIQMPVMNGVIATKEILKYEQLEKLDHTPIIAVTTNNLKGDRERYIDVGMDEYIPKPISPQKFINVIKQFYGTESMHKPKHSQSKNRTILLYKENPTEAKIMARMLYELGYSVDLAKNRIECSEMLSENSYHALLLDRSNNDSLDSMLMDRIYENKVETLLFTDENRKELSTSDLNSYIHLINKSSDFINIQEKLEKIM
ncbi:putative sensor protein [hydrothermal vent metagenome]|uniref:histidine kinase n=1 Tax=hydrothermal vent metagenome TaxID=652676 RepID=A0A1W1CDA6_9ZZZZ